MNNDTNDLFDQPYEEKPYFSRPYGNYTSQNESKEANEKRINNLLIKYSGSTDKKEWEMAEKIRLLQIVGSNLGMTGVSQKTTFRDYKGLRGDRFDHIKVGGSQFDRAKRIILNMDLRKLYRGGPGRKVEKLTIISAIAMYVMRNDNPIRSDCRYSNSFIKKIGVTKPIYDVISENIDKQLKKNFMIMRTMKYREEEETDHKFEINLPGFDDFLKNHNIHIDVDSSDLKIYYRNKFKPIFFQKLRDKIHYLRHVDWYFSFCYLLVIALNYSFAYSFVLHTNQVPEDVVEDIVEYVSKDNITFYYPVDLEEE